MLATSFIFIVSRPLDTSTSTVSASARKKFPLTVSPCFRLIVTGRFAGAGAGERAATGAGGAGLTFGRGRFCPDATPANNKTLVKIDSVVLILFINECLSGGR
jgi:hypothetical protein